MRHFQDDLQEAMAKLQEGKMIVQEATHKLSSLAIDMKEMSVGEAMRDNLIRFNFPVHPGVRKHFKEDR